MSLLQHSPTFSVADACKMAAELYGVRASAIELPSERDQNFLLVTDSGNQTILKIANALESHALLEAQNLVLDHLSHHVSFCPRVIPTLRMKSIEVAQNHLVRMITYLPGQPLGEISQYTPELLLDLGQKLGQLDRSLASFDHPSLHRDFHWDLANGPSVIKQHSHLIEDEQLKGLVTSITDQFLGQTISQLRTSIIHGDANDYNVLVDEQGLISGIVDFGDMVHSFTIGDLAVATAYVLLRADDPVTAMLLLVQGYQREFPLTDCELEALWPLILVRLCTSVSLAAYQRQQQPENEYLNISQHAIGQKLPALSKFNWSWMADQLRQQ